MPESVSVICFFVIVILTTIGEMVEKEDVSKAFFATSIAILASFVFLG